MKKISIVTPCYNEQGNVTELYNQVKKEFENLSDRYCYEHIFIDNVSIDNTRKELLELASRDHNVKLIFNAFNAGHIRSPFYALQQANGDAVMLMVADLQDPPSLIPEFLRKWESGYKVVVGIKNKSRENPIMYAVRTLFYKFIKLISETRQIENFTGFGLYDKSFIHLLGEIKDPYPYLRGIIAEYGGNIGEIYYTQPKRLYGKTSNNFYKLYDIAMLGFVNHSKVPLRVSCFTGFIISICSLLIALFYIIYKLCEWDEFQMGMAPLIIGFFFIMGVQMIFIGIIGEYVGSIFTQVRQRPLVIEERRVNFD